MNHDAYNNSSAARPGRSNYACKKMEVAVTDQDDGLSDYGSDFTADEEEILKGLLEQAPAHEANIPEASPSLQLRDIEDDESPRGAKVLRRLGYERRNYDVPAVQLLESEKSMVTIQIEGDSSLSPNGMFNEFGRIRY